MVGALFVGNQTREENAKKAIEASIRVRELLFSDKETCEMIGASSDMITKDVSFFVSGSGKSETLEFIPNIISEDCPERFLWENGCLLRCDLSLTLPMYVGIDKSSGKQFS